MGSFRWTQISPSSIGILLLFLSYSISLEIPSDLKEVIYSHSSYSRIDRPASGQALTTKRTFTLAFATLFSLPLRPSPCLVIQNERQNIENFTFSFILWLTITACFHVLFTLYQEIFSVFAHATFLLSVLC